MLERRVAMRLRELTHKQGVRQQAATGNVPTTSTAHNCRHPGPISQPCTSTSLSSCHAHHSCRIGIHGLTRRFEISVAQSYCPARHMIAA